MLLHTLGYVPVRDCACRLSMMHSMCDVYLV